MNKSNSSNARMPMQQQSSTSQSNSNKSAVGKNAVTIQNYAFSPATITVKAGDKVTWTNEDSVGHSATADQAGFDTGVLQQGQSGSVTFAKAGTFTYHCSVHPDMKGTVIVQ